MEYQLAIYRKEMFGNDFMDMAIKAQATENKLDFIKIKNFCASKNTVNKGERKSFLKGIKYLQIINIHIY